jgi:hypothetical protein
MKRKSDAERRRDALIVGASVTGALFTFEALDRLWNIRPGKNAVEGLRNLFGGNK